MSGGKDSPMVIDSDGSDSYESEDDYSPPGSPRSRTDTPPPPPPGTTSDGSPGQDNIVDGAQDYVDVDESPVVVDEKAALLEEFERKRRARQMHVPTEDSEVGAVLRQHGAPFCLFGEGPAERRDRLKDLLSRLTTDQQQQQQQQQHVTKQELPSVRRKEETWYHEGPKRLKEVRQNLLQYSIPRARDRLEKERALNADPTLITAQKQETSARLRRYQLLISQNADIRPVSCVRFSPDGRQLATASWSGNVQVWDVSDDGRDGSRSLRGHEGHVDSLAWHPQARISQSPAQLNLASCGRDGSVLLWGLESESCIASLPSVGARATEVAFHPCGTLLAVTVDDASWRLWDVEAGEEVLFQEGHSKGVCSISFQKDGALAATGGMDNFGRVWDLRTGRCVMFMAGHQGAILSVDWSPDCYHLASGSADNSVRIWDVRQRVSILTLPAHTKLVSAVRYEPCNGSYLATCSYDGMVRLWPHKVCQPLRTLQGHGHKIMSVDISPDGTSIATGAFDKTYKIWGPD
ncbi:U4/U6 small nuclear ribonucleoprotein Prp4 [Hyalella azteca]|uniref:U4/U6 small nuclear ribonucleoprotein Prp4 n=1 Tax=Hyalella azteca TaxID=294128 RepID=A0A8B7NS45_HYAAZ|nr:U4/U6 small nuclear ribonucleoprotein Prp4 [Hyalella azteca]